MGDLFQPVEAGGDWNNNASIGGRDEHDLTLAMGFCDLANLGVQHLTQHGPDDGLFLPTVYNFRHAFELALKVAVRTAVAVVQDHRHYSGISADPSGELVGELAAVIKRTAVGHSLGTLLDDLIAQLQQGEVEALPTDVIETIRQLHDLDPSGQAFRYSEVRQAGVLMPARPDYQVVDAEHLGLRLREAFSTLVGLLTVLEETRELYRETFRDWS